MDNTQSTKSIINDYPALVRLVKAGRIDEARELLLEMTHGHKATMEDIENAILRDTGRTIT